jgi:Right handed beta helix region
MSVTDLPSVPIFPGNAAEPLNFTEFGAIVTNVGVATVYYGDSHWVSEATAEGSIAPAASQTLFGTQYFLVPRSSERTNIRVDFLPETDVGASLATLTDVEPSTISNLRFLRYQQSTGKFVFKDPDFVDISDFDAVGLNGAADNTTAFENAATVAAAAGVPLRWTGTVRLTGGQIELPDGLQLHGYGPGLSKIAPVYSATSEGAVFINDLENGSPNGLSLRDFHLDKSGAYVEHGILVQGVTGFQMEGVWITGIGPAGTSDQAEGALAISSILPGSGPSWAPGDTWNDVDGDGNTIYRLLSTDVRVVGCRFEHTNNFGVQLGNVLNASVTGNTFTDCFREVIGIEPEIGCVAKNVSVTGNAITTGTIDPHGSNTGNIVVTQSSGGTCDTVTVAGNAIRNLYTTQVTEIVMTATGGTFTVTVDGQTTPAMAYNVSHDDHAVTTDMQDRLWALSSVGTGNCIVQKPDSTTFRITFNGLPDQTLTVSVDPTNLTGGTATVQAGGNANPGIVALGGTAVTITGNSVNGVNGNGITLGNATHATDRVTVVGNNIRNCNNGDTADHYGIALNNCRHCNVRANYVEGTNHTAGIAEAGTSVNNAICENTLKDATQVIVLDRTKTRCWGNDGIDNDARMYILGGVTIGADNLLPPGLHLNSSGSGTNTLSFRVGGLGRWNINVSGSESGSNVGSDLTFNSRADDGTSLNTPITFKRNTGQIQLGTGLRRKLSSVKTSTYTISVFTDQIVQVDTSGGTFTVNLPSASSAGAGGEFEIRDQGGACATNRLDVSRAGSDTMVGTVVSTTLARIVTNGGSLRFVSDGTSKWTVSQGVPLKGSKTWDPSSVATGAVTSTTVTVTGAAVGDQAHASFSVVLPAGCFLASEVTAADTVTVSLVNLSGSTQDVASGTLTARAEK